MKITRYSRRMFLQGAGGASLAIPFLPSLLPRDARAQTPTLPKRYVAIWSNYDYGHGRHWYPTSQPLAQSLQRAGEPAAVGYQPLRSLLGSRAGLSAILGEGLTRHLGSLNLMRGLDFTEYFGHGFGHNFGNYAGTVSNEKLTSLQSMMTLDQLLGRNPRINPVASEPFLLGSTDSCMSYGPNSAGAIVRKTVMAHSPQAIYQTLFRSGAVPESGQSTTAHPRRDVLSRVLEDYRRVRNGSQISTTDRVVLDNALDKLSEVHRNIAAQTQVTSGCGYKNISRTGGAENYDARETYKNMADLLVAAMMCDLNRVFHFSGVLNDAYYNKSTGLFHENHTHQPRETVAGKINHVYLAEIQAQLINNFVVPLLDGMQAATDAVNGKSILYNSLVHFSIESGTVHSWCDVPVLLAGNAGGALTSGHMIDYSNRDRYRGDEFNLPHEGWSGVESSPDFVGYYIGLPINRLFNTVLQAMGLSRTEYERSDINVTYLNRTDSALGAQNNGITELGGYGLVGVEDPPRNSQWMMYGHQRYKDFDFKFVKDTLAMPASSAA